MPVLGLPAPRLDPSKAVKYDSLGKTMHHHISKTEGRLWCLWSQSFMLLSKDTCIIEQQKIRRNLGKVADLDMHLVRSKQRAKKVSRMRARDLFQASRQTQAL